MKKHIGIFTLAFLVVGSLVVGTVTFQVDQLEDIVLIERFGEVTRVLHGKEDAGLHLKWPWLIEKVIRYDSRTFTVEDPLNQVTTYDQQTLLVSAYCTWKIADAKTFHKSLGAEDAVAQEAAVSGKVRSLLQDAKKAAITKHNISRFINADKGSREAFEAIEKEIFDRLAADAGTAYGVEIVSVGITALALPQSVTSKVVSVMNEERQSLAKAIITGGQAQADTIVSQAESARTQILAFAKRKEKAIRTEGDQAEAAYYHEFTKNPEFAIFLKTLDSLKEQLAGKTTIILSGDSLPGIRWLRTGPDLAAPK